LVFLAGFSDREAGLHYLVAKTFTFGHNLFVSYKVTEGVMDIFDVAIAIEKEGEAIYRTFANETSDRGAAHIFTWLANQEKKHGELFQELKVSGSAPVEESPALKGIRDIFAGWKETRARLMVKEPQVELYRQALDVEKRSAQFYEEAAHAATSDSARSAFLRIAAEEKTHQEILENVIEFITKPDFWAENAEFGHRGEDYYL
jgi:rubrerythrin